MKTFQIRAGEEFIKLGQLLKAAALVDTGADAKYAIEEEKVTVNGEICTMRGKKIHAGDRVCYDGEEIEVKA